MRILAVNCGSSSLKFALFELDGEPPAPRRLAGGRIGGIGGQAVIHFSAGADSEAGAAAEVPDHAAAMGAVLDRLDRAGLLAAPGLDGVGHCIVHGGPRLFEPAVLDDAVREQITAAAELAPRHNDAALAATDAARRRLGEAAPMVAVFDTAFHHGLPDRAARYAIPPDIADEQDIRRYGFHGLAHRWMAERCARLMGRPLAELKLITFQLGGGCSATAVEAGRSIDTSMGFTPLEGLVMGTRSGDIDPAVMRYLCGRTRTNAVEMEQWLTRRSGLLGVSGRSADVRDLLAYEAEGDRRARLALEMFCYRLRKYLGAYLAALGGTDAVAFGGGIGENAAEIRARVCREMAWCGLRLDETRNRAAVGEEAEISADDAAIRAYVIPVEEEILIAGDTYRCLASRNPAA